jgi:hypothetical protein
MGYADARHELGTRAPAGVPLEDEVTRMQESPSLGITFRETMSGGFHLGAVDPADGRRQGESAHTALTMHATVTIPDVRRFMQDPEHAGTLTGTIDFEPLGHDLPASRGVFNLFSPTDRPTLKLMVYELAFEAGGTPYYLAGRKEVHHDQGFDLWTDTTTLLTTLHEGTDRTGPIVGAGVLTLGADDLARLASTMRVTDAASLGDRTLTLTAFGRFFMGELWDSYATPPAGLRGLWNRVAHGIARLFGRRGG